MINPNIEIVVQLEEKINLLIEKYNSERSDNEVLRKQLSQLTEQLDNSSNEYSILQEDYEKLKMAKTIEATTDDVKDTKLRINQIVRDIDKCIALLNR